MTKRMLLAFAVLVILTGCARNAATPGDPSPLPPEGTSGAPAAHGHDHGATEPDAGNASPASVPADRGSGYDLLGYVDDQAQLFVRTNLAFSKENYGKAHQEGQGHVHLYINGRLIGPLQEEGPHVIKWHLQNGENEIKLALASNSHDESKYNTSYTFTYVYEPASQ
jgi:hypothetical protein